MSATYGLQRGVRPTLRAAFPGGRLAAGVALALVSPVVIMPPEVHAGQLPVPCAAGSCGANGPATWVTSGSANLVQVGNLLTINQTSANAVLNWHSFNISSDGTVTFKQPDAASVALNLIFQSDPSKILGALHANGSIYLINQNGIIFGAGAQVSVGSLIASSLNMTPQALAGILLPAQKGNPAFSTFVDANGTPVQSGAVQVLSGASITAPNGEILLLGPQVTNQGSLRADGGQVILAAGDSVYLAASSDPNLRGLLVEVGHGGTVTNAAASSPGGIDAGQISANQGDVTLVGLYVNQLGRVSATTSVRQNGSIHLLAQDGGSASAGPAPTLSAANGGSLMLGGNSHTDVSLDTASTDTAVDVTVQPKSQVVLVGQAVSLAAGSEITATSGDVAVTASSAPAQTPGNYAAQPGAGRLVIDPGASIDVSGANITLPMESNVIAVQLRGTELANSPQQRNGPLRGRTVYVDTRQSGTLANGTSWVGSPIGDLSGYVATVQKGVGERNLTGGAISLVSDGAVLVAPQANLKISGGSIDYQGGYVDTTKLLGTNGVVYDISRADPNQTYVGIVSGYSVTDSKWGVTQTYPTFSADSRGQYEPGYLEGKDAGAVNVIAPRVALDGNIVAATVIGPFQRNLPTSFDAVKALYRPIDQMPLSGQLTLGLAGGGTGGNNFLLPDVVFAPGYAYDGLTGPTGAAFNPLTDPLPPSLDVLQLRPALFGPNGIGQFDLYANGKVTLPQDAALQLPAAGQFSITAGSIDLAGTVHAYSGKISLIATPTILELPGAAAASLTVGPLATLDVSGEWVNDAPTPGLGIGSDPLAIAGGSVSIAARSGTPLDLAPGSLIDVSAGAQRTAAGQIVAGSGGQIAISVAPSTAAAAVPTVIGSTLEGYALKQGGSVMLSANAICIAATDCSGAQTGTLWVSPALFAEDGFANVSLTSNLGGLSVLDGTSVLPRQMNLRLRSDVTGLPTGTPFRSLAALDILPDAQRAPVNVSLNVKPVTAGFLGVTPSNFDAIGILDIGAGASVTLDPRASLSLSSDSSIVVDGSLVAPAGNISIATTRGLAVTDFLPAQGIWLEDGARLSTRGTALLQSDNLGRSLGSVLDGGSIAVTANRGYLITAPGSSIDASGTSAAITLAQASAPTVVGSSGGVISLTAAEGMLLNGSLVARGGDVPGTAGGTLNITLDGNLHGAEPGGAPIYPFSPRQIVVSDAAPVIVAARADIPDQYNGVAMVPAHTIESGGFSALQLAAMNLFDANGPQGTAAPVSTGSIVFPTNLSLQLPESIRLNAPQILTESGAKVELGASYVGLGYVDSTPGAEVGATAAPGPGTLQVQGNLVEFLGSLGLSGSSSTRIDSAGDIRFRGVQGGGHVTAITGTLQAAGDLALQAEQIYPTTLSQFTVDVAGAPTNTLEILPGGNGLPVLSAGGRLTLQADTILQGGVLRAPLGQLVLDAAEVTLEAGSVTSTSGAGQTIPFGATQAGADWVYSLPQGQTSVYTQSGPPAKSVQLQAGSIDVAKGAIIDISGGGDLQAVEFVPGVGGTVDVLANSNASAPGQFAIVPTSSLKFAPYDPQSQLGFTYAPGSSVLLDGGGGVAAGTYAILPASYALLPGAFLVRPVGGYTDIASGQAIAQLDGSTVVAGRWTFAGTGLESSRTQGFDLLPGALVQNLAQYNLTSADKFFTQQSSATGSAVPRLPVDAGQLQLLAGQQLQFLGDLSVAPAHGARGAEVDISAAQIEITNGTAGTPAAGTVAVDAAQLNALGAESLLVGGTRTTADGVTQVTTTASTLVLDAGASLTGSELLLTARDSLSVGAGAELKATGAAVSVPSQYDLVGGGAVLRVSTGVQTPIVRSGADGAAGALDIAPGATIKASGSATLEASGNFQSQAVYDVAGGSLAFTAARISLGSPGGAVDGLVLDPSNITSLNLGELDLTSRSAIDIYGVNTLAAAGKLLLTAAAIEAATGDAAALLQARQITLRGGSAAAPTPADASGGALVLQADHLTLAGGDMNLSGFHAVTLDGAAEIHADAAATIAANAPLTLHTAQLATTSGVTVQIASTGALQVLGPTTPGGSAAALPGAGGELDLSGSNVTIDTAISLPSGVLRVSVQGPAASDGITLGSTANLNVAGVSQVFDSKRVDGPGGRVMLDAAAGGISMVAGAQINLSAGSAAGAAGQLTIETPQGQADLQGRLIAHGGPGASGGEFALDAALLPDLAGLNDSLNAGGFAGLRSFRQRGSGDVEVAASARIQAMNVAISNDGGSIDVAGRIDASGATGGSVALAAAGAVSVEGSILAGASGLGEAGGALHIASNEGVVRIGGTGLVDLAGAAGAPEGTLSLRVPRSSLTDLLNPASTPSVSLGGTYRGVGLVQVEGVASYTVAGNTISAADVAPDPGNPLYADATAFMTHAAAIGNALKGGSDLNVAVLPGLQIQSSGDLVLGSDWDLSGWRFNGGPGILTLRAAGNLRFQASLSDGFDGASSFVLPSSPDQSWSYRLIAGADLSASNVMAVQTPGATGAVHGGSLQIAAGIIERNQQDTPLPIMIRTGTGNIDIAAAADLSFGNRTSVIYTAGRDSQLGVPLDELTGLAYPTAGGNINIDVGGNILGAPTNQLVTGWLWRAGQPAGPLSATSAVGWTVNYQWFEENVGALAGGNIHIDAGGNISELSVAIPTIGRQVGGTDITQSQVQVTGGGDLSVQSGGNITGGSYFVDRGTGVITAWGAVGSDTSHAANTTGHAPLLALGDATIDVTARSGLTLESALNPFLLPLANVQGPSAQTLSEFSTYSSRSAIDLVSSAGDVTLLNQPAIDGLRSQLNSMSFSASYQQAAFVAYPGNVDATALSGNLVIDGASMVLWPSSSGNLNLLAQNDVVFAPQQIFLMSGLDPASLPSPAAPVQNLSQLFTQSLFVPPAPGVAAVPIHLDAAPARVVAATGDVKNANLAYIPKSIHVVAGRDIVELALRAMNLVSTDASIVSAGRNIDYALPRDPESGSILPDSGRGVLIEGPGALLIEAGGNVNLGTSNGVLTVGNQYNPAIASGGAGVSVVTGATVGAADLAAFIARYLANSNAYDTALIQFVQDRSSTPIGGKSAALAAFSALAPEQQFALCEQILFDEIRSGGRSAAAPGPGHDDYSRSFLALETLFPGSTKAGTAGAAADYPGSLSLYFSEIYTLDGGGISLVTPGGGVNVGLSTPPASFGISKSPSQLGIVAQGAGDIASVSYGDFLVNQSRVFAADGGNILVWSTAGNVDAGRGAKTAISAPAPTITFNAQGQIQTVFPAALQGSGIQALATTAGVTPGDVDLYAPRGIVNAGDAGIVAGNLTIGATAVLGRDNISVTGVSVGVPVDSSGLGASLAGSSSVSSSATSSANLAVDSANKGEGSAPLAQSALGFLDVFIMGLGDESCKPDDVDCLKRQGGK